MQKENYLRRTFALIMAFLMIVSMMPLNVSAQDTGSAGEKPVMPYETNPDGTKNTGWPLGNIPLITVYSGSMDQATGPTGIRYLKTAQDDQGRTYMEFQITQVGQIGERNTVNYDNFNTHAGKWADLILHFDDILFESVDLDKSYIEGVKDSNNYQKNFYFTNREKGPADPYNTDGKSVTVPFSSIFGPGIRWERQDATLRLYTKAGAENLLTQGENYLIEFRIGTSPKDRYGYYFRNYIYGRKGTTQDEDRKPFNYPDYIKYTGSVSFPYGATISKPKYVDDKLVKISNVHTEVYVDWDKNEVYVDYLYENIQNFIPIGAQFVQIIPKALYDSLAPRYVGGKQVVAKFNHVYKYGTTGDGGDEGVSLYASNFTIGNRADDFKYTADSSGDRAAFRLQRPTSLGAQYQYTHPWESIKALQKADQGGVPQAVNMDSKRARYLAHSTSYGPLENHTTYYIDPDKFRENFKDIDDLSIESFFVVNARDEGPGILANSDSSSTPSYSKAITNSPLVDEIYDDAKEITGKTGYSNSNQNVFIEAKNYKDENDPNKVKFTKDHIQGVNGDGSFNLIPGTFGGVFENMEKDDKLTFETIYQYENHFKSAPTIKKVKSRIYFKDYEADPQNPDKRIDKVVEVPASTLFRGQTGYKETGLGDKMPEAPVKKGYIFKGWATKPISAKDYIAQDIAATGNVDKVKALRDIKGWAEEQAYKFDKDTPINKSYEVYPVWEEEVKSFNIILHSNYGTGDTKTIEVNYGENLPSLKELTSKALTQDQYAAIAGGNYSEKSVLPNAYQVDNKDKGIFGKREKYNFVGWSTMADNGGEMIESLYSNKAMLAVEGEGKDRKFYLSTVKTTGVDIGQAAASKQFKEIEIKNDEIHLYAAWKPYFHMTVNKTWYDASGETYKQAYVNDILSAIAHGQQVPIKDDKGNTTGAIDAPIANPVLARDVHVGLLYRTAVTEANKPTVTGDANYYIVDGSIKELPATTNKAEWDLPSYDGYGKRLSYIAVEFKDKAAGDAAFDRFNQKWNNIWTNVGNNLADISEWTNTTIAKVQNVELNHKDVVTGKIDKSKVDAFTSATVRKLVEDDKAITERDTNKSTVGSKPVYTTNLYNVKSSMGYPNFKKIFDGATEVDLIPSDDKTVKVVSFDLPSEFEPIYFKRQDDGTWTRVVPKSDNTGWDSYDRGDKDKYIFAPDNSNPKDPSWALKFNLEKYPRLERQALKTGEIVRAKYYGDTPVINSIWSQQEVENKPVTPTLNGLEQMPKVKDENGKEYVVIRAVKPNAELGQFKEDATLTLIHHDKAKEGKLVDGEAYKDAEGKNVTATEKDGYYYFKVPVENIKHDDVVGVHGHQDLFVDSRSTIPLTIDLQGPVITAENQTVFNGEDVDLAEAVTTDEGAKLVNGTLPNGLSLKQKENADLGTEWKLEGKADKNGETTVKLTATDKFGNVSEKTDWKIKVVDRPETDSIDSFGKDNAKQIPNDHDGEFKNITHRIEITKVIPGSTIKVYLRDPASSLLPVQREFKVPADHNGSFILDIPENLGKNILDEKLYLTQTEEGKKESKATAVDMDVIPPTAPTIEANPGENTVTLSNISSDTTNIYLNVDGKKYTLDKMLGVTTWILQKPDGDRISVEANGGIIVVDLNVALSPKQIVKLVAVDEMINPSGAQKTVPQFEQPAAPTITAENKNNVTEVSGKTKYPGELIKIYTVKTVTDPDTGDISKEYTIVERVFADPQGNYKVTFPKDNYKPGTVFASSVTVNGIESNRAEATLYENTDVIPFDPENPPVNPDDDPNNPDPPKTDDERKYVTVTLDANGGKFAPGTKSSFYVKKTHVLTTSEFEDAKLHLQAPIDKTFDKWTEDQDGKTAYVEKAFTENATIYASYKADGNIIPFDPDDPNKPDKPDDEKYVTITLNPNGGSFEEGTKSSFYVKKEYTVTTNDFAVAEKGLKAPKDKAFKAWYLDKDGKTPFPSEGKKFDADASVFAAYKEDRDIIPVDDETKEPEEGYVRVTIEKDDKTVRFLNTEAKHSYDVKLVSKVRYADVINVVRAEAQNGYKDLKWYEKAADETLTLANEATIIDKAVTLYAKAVNAKDIIDVPNPDDTEITEGYVRVTLAHDDTVTFTNTVTTFDVNANGSIRYADVYAKAGAQAKDGYKDLKWYKDKAAVKGTEIIDKASDGLVLTAKAVNEKDIIPVPNPGDNPNPPAAYVRVTLVKDTGVSEIKGVTTYDIKADGSVRYADIIEEVTKTQGSKTSFTLEDGYRKPLIFKIGEADLVMTAYPAVNTEIKVSATQKDAGKYNPVGVIQDVKKDETPKAENSIGNKEELPEGTTYEFVDDQGNKTTPKTDQIGEQPVTVKVTYPDGSSETVDTKINIVPRDDIIDVKDPDHTDIPKGYIRVRFMDDTSVVYGKDVTRACDIRESALATVKYSSLWTRTTVNPAQDYRKPISWYLGQSTDAVTVDRLVKDDVKADTKVLEITPKATQTDASIYDPKGQELKVTQGSTIEAKDFISNKEDMPIGTKYDFVKENPNKPGEYIDDTPDTNKLGKQDLKIKVTFPDKSTKIVPAKMDVVPKDNIVKVDDPDNTPVPTGFVRVTLVNDPTSVKEFKETYDVKVSANIKFGEVLRQAGSAQPNDKYTTPITWKNNGIEVDKLGTVLEKTTLTAFAKLKDSEKYNPEVQDQTVKQGDTPKAEDSIKNKDKLPDGTKYEFVNQDGTPNTPDTSKPGEQKPHIKVIYPDGSSEIVGPTTIKVVPDKDIIPVKPGDEDTTETPEGYVRVTLVNDQASVQAYKRSYDVRVDAKVAYGTIILGAPEPTPADKYTTPITWKMGGNALDQRAIVDKTSELTAFATAKVKPEVQDQTVKQGDTPDPADSIKNKDKLPEDTKYEFVNQDGTPNKPDTTKPGEQKPYVKVEYPDGTSEIVGPTTIKVVPDKDIIPVPDPDDENQKTPEGYVRVTLNHDDTVTFAANVVTTYDVKADGSLRYSDVCDQVKAQPAQGFADMKWYKDDRAITLTDKLTEKTAFELTAKAVHSDSIIPVKPGDENKPSPNGYVRVNLTKDETSVQFTATDAPTFYDVKADGTVYLADVYAKVQAVPVEGYKDLTWYKGEEAVKITERVSGNTPITLNAKAVKDLTDDIIPVPNPGDNPNPPAGYVRITLQKGTGLDKLSGITTYDVKSGKPTRYSDIIAMVKVATGNPAKETVVTLTDGYREPLVFTVAGNKVDITDYPSRATTIVVGATEKDSNKYTPEVQEQTVNQGDTPKAEDSIKNKDQLPDGTKYEFVDDNGQPTTPDTNEPGEKDVKIKVTYPDGSEDTVDTKIKVEKNKPEKPDVEPIKEGDDKVVVTPPTDGDKVIVELPDGTKVEVTKDPDTDTWKTPDENGEDQEVPVNDKGKLEIPVDPTKVVPGNKPVEVVVEDTTTGKKSDPTEVPIVEIPKQLEQIKLSVKNLNKDERGIAVLTNPTEANIIVYKDNVEVGKSITNALGKVTIILTQDMVSGEKYIIIASKDGYLPNEITMTVK